MGLSPPWPAGQAAPCCVPSLCQILSPCRCTHHADSEQRPDVARRVAPQGELTHTPASHGVLSSSPACQPRRGQAGIVQGFYFRDTQGSGSLYTESWGDKRTVTRQPGACRVPAHRGDRTSPGRVPSWQRRPVSPTLPPPVPTLPRFPNGLRDAPQAQGLPTQPQTHRSHPAAHPRAPAWPPPPPPPWQRELWTRCPTCAGRAGHRGHLPTRGETPPSKHKPAGPARILLAQHRPCSAPSAAAAEEQQRWLCLQGDSPCGVYGWGQRGSETPPASCSKGRGSINHDPPSPAKGGDSAPHRQRRFLAPYGHGATP